MPIYEFKCSECEEFFEVITVGSKVGSTDEKINGCPKCGSKAFERVVSRTNYVMGSGSAAKQTGVQTQERNCSSGSCTTYTIPGETP